MSDGCKNCYAEVIVEKRFHSAIWGVNGTRTRTKDWRNPRKWDKEAKEKGIRFRVFCASLADVFEDREDLKGMRDELHELIRDTPNLDWLLLTKRPSVAAAYYESHPLPENVWIGTSVESREVALARIPILSKIPAKIRFLSCEPLLSDLGDLNLEDIHWVIVGGESGPNFRPLEKSWIVSILDQCTEASIPFFFKQWAALRPKKLGYEINGKAYHEFPTESVY